MNTIDEYNIDLKICPPSHSMRITQCTMGDLHANAIKFLYVLIRNGVLACSPEHYQRALMLYQASFTKHTKQQFDTLIDSLEVINSTTLIRLLGDTLADRGNHDWFVLKIFEKLMHAGVSVRITLSNHDQIFLNVIGLNGESAKATLPLPDNISRSYLALYRSLEDGIMTKSSVDDLVNQVYLPQLILLDYSFYNEQLTIFSHAPMDLDTIKELAQQFEVLYEGPCMFGLMRTIEQINKQFKHMISLGLLNQAIGLNTAVYNAIWMREKGLFLARGNQETRDIPGLRFVYGHDLGCPKESLPANIIRLDNSVGKGNLQSNGEQIVAYVSSEPIVYNI